MTNAVLGVDIGGTKIAAGMVSQAGDILNRVRVPMIARSSEEALGNVYRAIESALQGGAPPARAIGVSCPGPLDPTEGVILTTPNLPYWRNFPLRDEIEQKYGLPTRLENDANAAGLAEALWGAGAGYGTVFYVTFGTGVGTAIVLDKNVFHGRTGAAAEGGHMTIDMNAPVRCGCGKPGCLEGMVSGAAIAGRLQARLAGSPEIARAWSSSTKITSEIVFDACETGDAMATAIVREVTKLIAVWLGNIVDLLEPDVIVVGGGVGARLGSWLPEIALEVPRWTINPRADAIPLVQARYGVDSGLAGAAALWLPKAVPSESVAGSQS